LDGYLGSYALIATATDYDAWRPHSDTVTVSDVFNTLKANADTSRHVAATILDDLVKAVTCEQGSSAVSDILSEEVGSMEFSIMPHSDINQNPDDVEKLSYILPQYFGREGS